MTISRVKASVRLRDGLPIIDIIGDLSSGSDGVLEEAYASTAEYQPATLLLNFSETGYISSAGIALIVGVLSKALRDGVQIIACGLTEHYQKIFEITRLSDFIRVFPDEESALASMPPGNN